MIAEQMCKIGHHLWGIGHEKAAEGMPVGVLPFRCARCDTVQLMTSRTSAKLNRYCMIDKRCAPKPKMKVVRV